MLPNSFKSTKLTNLMKIQYPMPPFWGGGVGLKIPTDFFSPLTSNVLKRLHFRLEKNALEEKEEYVNYLNSMRPLKAVANSYIPQKSVPGTGKWQMVAIPSSVHCLSGLGVKTQTPDDGHMA